MTREECEARARADLAQALGQVHLAHSVDGYLAPDGYASVTRAREVDAGEAVERGLYFPDGARGLIYSSQDDLDIRLGVGHGPPPGRESPPIRG